MFRVKRKQIRPDGVNSYWDSIRALMWSGISMKEKLNRIVLNFRLLSFDFML